MSSAHLRVMVAGLVMLVAGLFAAANIQEPDGVHVEEVHFTSASGAGMRALLFRPDTATADNPSPAILAVHGYLNSAELQANFAVEFARRGYVVLAPDQRGHGGSDPEVFAEGFGGPAALAYLRSLPFVDKDNIGLEGHSMGGWAVLSAAKAYPDGYRSVVLEGSSAGAPFAPEGDKVFPRNLMVVFGTRDEFGAFMWGEQAPLAAGATTKMKRIFDVDDELSPGKLYGSIADGTARRLETPHMAHAWLHESSQAIGYAIDWFDKTLSGQKHLSASDQIWPWKEFAGAVALLGIAPFLIGLFGLALHSDVFASLRAGAGTITGGVGIVERRIGALAMAVLPVSTYLPLMHLSEALLGQNKVFRQTFTNQILFWLVCMALLSSLALFLTRKKGQWDGAYIFKSVLLAAGLAISLYVLIAGAEAFAHVVPQWWIVIWRPLTAGRFHDFLIYLPAAIFIMVVMAKALDRYIQFKQVGFWRGWLMASACLSFPFVVFLSVQYGFLAATGALFSPEEGLRVIISIVFVPVLLLIAAIFSATTQAARGTLPGALLCAFLLAWFLTATQPIGVS